MGKIKFKDIFYIVVGTFIVAFAFSAFFIPNEIAPGGVSGFATLMNALFKLPVGWVMLACNIPLFLFGWKKSGLRFMVFSLISTILLSFFIELLDMPQTWLQVVREDVLLSTVFGGALMGLGLGLVIKQGVTTGGTDLLAKLINDIFPNISIAWVLFAIDFLVVISAAIFLTPLAGLYSMVALYIGTVALDFVQTGIDSAKAFMIISDNSEEITEKIIEKMDRSATILNGQGAFTKQDKPVLLCVVHRTQIAQLRSIVKGADEKAFMVIYNVKEVDGEGFTWN